MMLEPVACMTVPFFTSVTVTGVTVVRVVIVAVPFMPGFNSRTDICCPSMLKRKSSATVSSLVPSGSRTVSWLPYTASTSKLLVSWDVVDCCASDTTAVRLTAIAARNTRLSVRTIRIFSILSVLRGHLRFVARKHGTDDEPLRGGADEVERIASDQRQRPCGRG